MTRRQRAYRVEASKIKDFIYKRFEENGETIPDFIGATDYTRQAVQLVLTGDVGSPRIRQDIARYLGYERWSFLVEDYVKREGTEARK